MTIDDAIAIHLTSAKQGIHAAEQLQGLSIDEAYRVQLGILDRLVNGGQRQAGWKVGLTSTSLQKAVGYPQPVFGYLLESARQPSPASIPHGSLVRPAIEAELCLTLGVDLRGPGISLDDAREAIVQVAPSLEIIERRQRGRDLALSLVDNAQQKAFVVGDPMMADGLDLAAVQVDIGIGGRSVARAFGSEVLGNPLASIVWLANTLAGHGLHLAAGSAVMSGSFTVPIDVAAGDSVSADFGALGCVRATFA